MTKEDLIRNIQFFSEKVNKCWEEMIQINRKYNCSSTILRSDEDEARFYELSNEIDKIEEEWDRTYPATPCPQCGHPRKASFNFGQSCLNIGKCKLIMYLGG